MTDANKLAILSAPWYLDHVHSGSDWLRLYNEDPMDFPASNNETAKQLILGGEACLWAEYVNSVNLVQRAWPRASAVAERLWSPAEVKNEDDAARRLEEHQCRMLSRGYSVQPQVGAGFCHVVWQRKK